MKISVHSVTGENAVTKESGEKLYSHIYPLLAQGQDVELDFTGVRRHLTVFFNFAIGQLYRDIEGSKLDRLITVSNLSAIGQRVLTRVKVNAKRYYSDDSYKQAMDTLVRERTACL